MRSRFVVPAVLVAAATLVAAPAAATAKPGHVAPKKITINATPNPDVTGDPVFIYGQVNLPSHANVAVKLFHRLPLQPRFTPAGQTTTNAAGFYSFARADGVVRTNRNWFVKVGNKRSRVVHEKVFAELTLAASPAPYLTNHPITFAGTVTPPGVHVGERVLLQVQQGVNGDRWKNIDRGLIGAGGAFVIKHRFRQPDERTLRVVLRKDRWNLRSESSPIDINVEQTQNPRFTILASGQDFPATPQAPLTFTGQLTGPRAAGQVVTLLAHTHNKPYAPVSTTMSDATGHYSITVTSPVQNTFYRATVGPRKSAQVFVGVHDVVSIAASATTALVGGHVTITGTVIPNKSGHVIYLQRKGDDGFFHTIAVGTVGALSHYAFGHTFGSPGTKVYRTLVPGGPVNRQGVSATVTITVAAAVPTDAT